jgi:hypothetical protein
MNKWISIDKKLPEKETPDYSVDVLITDGKKVKIGYYDYSIEAWDTEYEESYASGISHWMHLPKPPRK